MYFSFITEKKIQLIASWEIPAPCKPVTISDLMLCIQRGRLKANKCDISGLCTDQSTELDLITVRIVNEPVHEISNNMVCATSKASDQPAHTRSLIRAFASRLSIL